MKNSKLVIKPLAEATEEEQKQLIDAVQQMLNAQKAEKVPMENDEFEIYRCNLGVVSLNLPMIYQKSKRDGTNFFDELDYYRYYIISRCAELAQEEGFGD